MPKRSKTITVTVNITGIRETIKSFKGLPPDANKEIREFSAKLADRMVGWMAAKARSGTPQMALLVPTIKRLSDRLPIVQVGGTKALTPAVHHGRTPPKAWEVLFGANFGANDMWRFPNHPHRRGGTDDYFAWVSIKEHQSEIDAEFNAGIDAILGRWAEGGDQV